jgi:basic membrane protein A
MSRSSAMRVVLLPAVVLSLSVALTACGSSGSSDSSNSSSGGSGSASGGAGASGKKIVMIGVAPVTSGDWEPANYGAFTAMAKKYGLKSSHQESVGYDQAGAVLARLAPDNDLIIADSGGYESAVLQVAPKYPKTWFFLIGTDPSVLTKKLPPNVAAWAINTYETGYLAGTAACLAAKAKAGDKIGWVNSVPIPAFMQYAGSAQAAAQKLGCGFMIRWTNSFEDVSKAKQAALSMINAGADTILSSADTSDAGSRAATVQAGKQFVALFTASEVKLAPKNTVTAVAFGFPAAYDEMGKLFTSGQIQPKGYVLSVENGRLNYALPFKNTTPSVQKQSLAVFNKLKNGTLTAPQRSIKP